MAPKKAKEEPKERPILGRFRSNLKVRMFSVNPPSCLSVDECAHSLGVSSLHFKNPFLVFSSVIGCHDLHHI